MKQIALYILGFSALLVFTVLGFWYAHRNEYAPTSAVFTTAILSDTTTFTFELADTDQKQIQGLSGRASIPNNYGMLFTFKTDDQYAFWMKDMLVPIDIIWLSDNGTILGVEDSISPDTYPAVFYPPQPVRYVLETRAGESRLLNWTTGTHVPIPLKD